jgi:HK97 family phage prohead protease
MERHNFSLKVKSVAPDGSFVGMGAVYGNTDLGGDQIQPGAFARTIAAKQTFPLLWQHDPSSPIGTVKVTDSPGGLQVQGQLLLSDPTAQKAYSFLKAGIIRGLSIGFETIQDSLEDGVRMLKELRLWEISVVTFPMNLEAAVTSVKAMSDADRATHFKAIDEHRKAIDRHQRGIREHLKAMTDALDDEDDESDLNPGDDPALLDSPDDQDPADEGMAMVLQELKALATQAEELASA